MDNKVTGNTKRTYQEINDDTMRMVGKENHLRRTFYLENRTESHLVYHQQACSH